jgi:pyruvate,water dikinase
MKPRLIVAMGETAGPGEIGGKAAALLRLASAGFPVPECFALTPAAFEASVAVSERGTASGAFRELLREAAPAPGLVTAMKEACAAIGPAPYAVRSSAVDEDGSGHSFAGQLESYLFVSGENLAERVAGVWRSGFSDRVLAYRKERGLSDSPCAPAVLVQRMIEADAAGVAFSADPVSGARSRRVVSAVFGIGTALVSGEADADTWRIDRSGRVLERLIADKAVRHRLDASAAEGVSSVPVDASLRLAPALSDAQAVEVARLAESAEAYFGAPQDIEWALKDGRLYLLQSRPITSMAPLADPEGERIIWDNSNITESYAGVTTPLTFSFARRAYEEVYRQFCLIMGVPAAKVESNSRTFRNMLGLIRGRVYYNLTSWYRTLALLPGFTLNRRFMEQMMGVREPMPEAIVAELARAGAADRIADAWHLARMIAKLAGNHVTVTSRIRDFHARLEDALREPEPPLAVLRLDELAAAYRGLESRLLTRWDAPLVNDFLAMIFYGVLRKLAQSWCGDADGTLQNDLLCGEGGMISAEPAKRVVRLGELARPHAALVELLDRAPPERIAAAMPSYPEFHAAYRDYLARFGDRCMEELKLESATLHDEPTTLLRAIGQTAGRAAPRGAGGVETSLRAAAELRVREAIGSNHLKRPLFDWVLANARARVRDRENLRFERTRLFGRVRRIFVEIGRRLAALGRLEEARDVFYLEVEEALGFIEGTATATDLSATAAARKEEFNRYRAMPAPADRFETFGAVHQGNAFEAAGAAPPAASGETVKGIGCCPGVVRAPVRVVTDPRAAVLRGGEILVAERTDPGWIMLFPSCSGLLVERGSLLSHSAIVAREMGIPAIVSIPGVMRWVQDGEWVEMDGASGVARKIPAPAGAPAT